MKKLHLLVLAMLIAITGTEFVEAKNKKSCMGRVKSDCKGICEWRNKKCRHKKDDKDKEQNSKKGGAAKSAQTQAQKAAERARLQALERLGQENDEYESDDDSDESQD